jgi:CheY-like chemotaxis protein
MHQFKVALLDDNKDQLEKNKSLISSLNLLQIVSCCSNAEDFLKDVALTKPDILFLDLNLGDSYMTGMEVAFALQLPVMFISSNTPQYIKEMEVLKREFSICVDHLTKPFLDIEFQKTVRRFIEEVTFFSSRSYCYLDLASQKRTKINIKSIVCLVADKSKGSLSNNKQIYFTDRKPETLVDFSFTKMVEKGLLASDFITIHKSFRVHTLHIQHYLKKEEIVLVETN